MISIPEKRTHQKHLLIPAILLFTALLFSPALAAEGPLTGKLNVNTATVEELMRLPYVGEARARAIIDYRKSHGHYTSLEQLTASKTVGQSTYEAIKPYLMISGDSTLAAGAGDGNSPLTADGLFSTKAGDIRVLADREYYQALLLAIDNAKERIDMTMFLFKTTGSPQNRPARLVRALGEARDRGVDVRVILEQSDRDGDLNAENQRVAEQLRKRRVRVDFDSPENTTHAKLVVIDHRWLFTGSHNLTEAALSHNREFSLLIDDPDLANHATAYLMKIK